MATKRTLDSEDIEQVLALESESDDCCHSSGTESDEDIEQQQQLQPGTNAGGESNWGPPRGRNKDVHVFTGPSRGINKNEAPHINKDSTPLSVLMLYFTGVVQLLVEQTDLYYRQYCDSRDDGPSSPFPVDDLTMSDVLLFLAVTLQIGHDIRDSLKDYWSTLEQLHTPFYSNTMERARYFHILRFLHFSDNKNKADKTHENYDRLWKLRTVFGMFNEAFGKYYNLCEHLAVDKVIAKFKGRVIFKQFIPSKRKRFGIKIYKLSDATGFTYDMRVYLGKDANTATKEMTATHATVINLTRRVEGVGHKLFMDNFFSSPALFDDLSTRKINCCGTVRPNRKDMPPDFGRKTLRLKNGDIRVRSRADLTALVWKDKREVYILTNMHQPPTEGNFCDEHSNAHCGELQRTYTQE